MLVRKAQAEDLSEVAKIHAECWSNVYGKFMHENVIVARGYESRLSLWRERLKMKKGDINVLVINGQIVGFCYTRIHHDPGIHTKADMNALYIGSHYRGGRSGALLAIQMADDLIDRGFSDAYCCTFLGNRAARLWYHQLGWESILKRERVIEGDKIPEVLLYQPDLYRMRQKLLTAVD